MSNSNDFPSSKRPPPDAKAYFPSPWCCSALPFSPARCSPAVNSASPFHRQSAVDSRHRQRLAGPLCRVAGLDRRAQRPEYGADGPLLLRGDWQQAGRFYSWLCRAGWYAWGTATVAISLVKILALPEALTQPLMVLFGILFCVTALVGYKGLDALSRLSVPLMFVLLMVSMYLALHHAGGWQAMTRIAPSDTMTSVGGHHHGLRHFRQRRHPCDKLDPAGQLQPDRHSRQHGQLPHRQRADDRRRRPRCAIVYQQADIVEVLILQGLSVAAVIMLCLNLLTIQWPHHL